MIVVLTCVASAAVAGQKQADQEPLLKNEIEAKASANYFSLPRLHLPVLVDANRRFRALELEVWLLPTDEANLALVRSAKKKIMAAMTEDFSAYDWEAFTDSQKGPDIAKRVVTTSVERASNAKLSDVFIKTLLLR